MARSRSGPSLNSIFVGYFKSNPKWLGQRTNEEVFALFEKDHPNIPVDKRVKTAMAGAKTRLRKQFLGGKQSPRAKAEETVAAHKISNTTPLYALEEQIDESLSLARRIDRDALTEVIKHLHRARNKVVFMIES